MQDWKKLHKIGTNLWDQNLSKLQNHERNSIIIGKALFSFSSDGLRMFSMNLARTVSDAFGQQCDNIGLHVLSI